MLKKYLCILALAASNTYTYDRALLVEYPKRDRRVLSISHTATNAQLINAIAGLYKVESTDINVIDRAKIVPYNDESIDKINDGTLHCFISEHGLAKRNFLNGAYKPESTPSIDPDMFIKKAFARDTRVSRLERIYLEDIETANARARAEMAKLS